MAVSLDKPGVAQHRQMARPDRLGDPELGDHLVDRPLALLQEDQDLAAELGTDGPGQILRPASVPARIAISLHNVAAARQHMAKGPSHLKTKGQGCFRPAGGSGPPAGPAGLRNRDVLGLANLLASFLPAFRAQGWSPRRLNAAAPRNPDAAPTASIARAAGTSAGVAG